MSKDDVLDLSGCRRADTNKELNKVIARHERLELQLVHLRKIKTSLRKLESSIIKLVKSLKDDDGL